MATASFVLDAQRIAEVLKSESLLPKEEMAKLSFTIPPDRLAEILGTKKLDEAVQRAAELATPSRKYHATLGSLQEYIDKMAQPTDSFKTMVSAINVASHFKDIKMPTPLDVSPLGQFVSRLEQTVNRVLQHGLIKDHYDKIVAAREFPQVPNPPTEATADQQQGSTDIMVELTAFIEEFKSGNEGKPPSVLHLTVHDEKQLTAMLQSGLGSEALGNARETVKGLLGVAIAWEAEARKCE